MFDELVTNITNVSVFTDSIQAWVSNLSVNTVIVFIMMIFMIVGAIDKIRGNKLGYGEKFEEGFNAIGPLAIAMAGVVAAAPVLAILLGPILKPVYGVFGADPSMFATTLLACDMGGYPLAMKLAADPTIGNFAGLILGSMMGPTIVFTIPVALSIIKKEDRPYLGAGVLAGLITIPIGCIAGGLVMNMTEYKISLLRIVQNLIPVIIVAALIVIGLWRKPDKMINGFVKFGNGVTVVITVFTAIAVFEYETKIKFPLFDIMMSPPQKTAVGRCCWETICCMAVNGAARMLATTRSNCADRVRQPAPPIASCMGFTTVECGRDILRCLDTADAGGCFLLDSVTALLDNEMFASGAPDPSAPGRVASALEELTRRAANAVFVSDYLYGDAQRFDGGTECYRRGLAEIDRRLAACCDTVVEVCAGLCTVYKGGLPV